MKKSIIMILMIALGINFGVRAMDERKTKTMVSLIGTGIVSGGTSVYLSKRWFPYTSDGIMWHKAWYRLPILNVYRAVSLGYFISAAQIYKSMRSKNRFE